MASIAGSNTRYNVYADSIVGKTTTYATRIDLDGDTTFIFFSDDGTVDPDDTHNFVSSYATSENPAFASREVLGSPTAGTVAPGIFDAADAVFDGGQLLTGATSQESIIIAKFDTNAASSPLLVHFGSATGLPLTPNGASTTVAFSASGIFGV